MSKINIPIANPIIEDEEIEEVIKVLKSGFISQGPKVAEFEKEFAEFINTKYAIATSSGTAALHTALLASEIGEKDEVITTPFSFVATGNSILYTGAKPVFVDIDKDTYNIDPDKIEIAINEKTKAIMPVHLYGQSADMDEIMKIAKKNNLIVIEDGAQAHGAIYKKKGSIFNDKKIGSIGDLACFSFYPTKNMTTGEGGIITTNNKEYANKAKMFVSHGESERYKHSVLGYNFRMTDISAVIGLVQLKKLNEFNHKRIKNAKFLNKELSNVKGIKTPKTVDDSTHVYHQYTISIENGNRDDWIKFINDNGVATGIHYPIPIYKQELYENLGFKDKCPVSENLANKVVSLPVHPKVTKRDLKIIADVLKRASIKFNT
ncbi:MAG: DegT/DnrJ/EryC1/StrS family aminotransferase [Methanobrevibacter sp.]|jgi:dTDP-4-amino-4,6-dideoxygalactose transaminase|nr:DegT/DnrJ/EryC1/StrS family aminotransferase [Candidatus Methanovirga meridionalis]